MIARVFRAFIGALRLTLSGKTVQPSPIDRLLEWTKNTPPKVDSVIMLCNQAGLDEAGRKNIQLVVEGRRVNLNTVLLAVKFHAQNEYPMLLKTPDSRSVAAVYGTTVNDTYLVGRFTEALPAGAAQTALKTLLAHLEAIPQDVS